VVRARFFPRTKWATLLVPKRNVTDIVKIRPFHVATHPIPPPRPRRRRWRAPDGSPGRRSPGRRVAHRELARFGGVENRPPVEDAHPGGSGRPRPSRQLARFECVEKWPTANWSDLGVSKKVGLPGTPPTGQAPAAGHRGRPSELVGVRGTETRQPTSSCAQVLHRRLASGPDGATRAP
jgi:hypothetical protein